MHTIGLLLLVLHLLHLHVLGELVGVHHCSVSLDVHQHKRGSNLSEKERRLRGD